MTDDDRARAVVLRDELAAMVTVVDVPTHQRAVLGLVTALLMAKPIAGASAETGKARAESYLVALDDVPPWAIAGVIRRWHRGECGSEYDYRWAPDTATLRRLSLEATELHRRAHQDLTRLIEATTIDEALQRPVETPEQRAKVSAGFTELVEKLRGKVKRDADLQAAE